MRIFKTRMFQRWAGKAGVTDVALLNAVAEIERGLVDAKLGGNLYKQRVALPGRGKSGSARTILATRFEGMLFFLFGFEKNDRDNILRRELVIYQSIVCNLLGMTTEQIELAIKSDKLMEVEHEPND